MRVLRFRQDPDEGWTYCSFAGPGEVDAQAVLVGRLLEAYELQLSDDETEGWTDAEGSPVEDQLP